MRSQFRHWVLKIGVCFIGLNPAHVFAASPPLQSTVDLYVTAAITAKAEDLNIQGPITCRSAINPQSDVTGSGKSLDLAESRYLMKCIVKECERLDGRIAKAMEDIFSQSDESFRDQLLYLGKSNADIEMVIAAKNNPPQNLPKLTCQNASPLARTLVFDICAATPMQCQEK